jgi:hypothetical protein
MIDDIIYYDSKSHKSHSEKKLMENLKEINKSAYRETEKLARAASGRHIRVAFCS